MQLKSYSNRKRHCLFLLLILITVNKAFAQPNLVQNSNFEAYNICPTFANLAFSRPDFWYMCSSYTGVYEHACSPDVCGGIPFNCIKGVGNYQPTHSGNGYIYLDYFNGPPDGRTYLQSKLKDSLLLGHKYYVEFFVNLPNTVRFACNNNGLLFTKAPAYVDTVNYPFGVLAIKPQILGYGNPVITDTLGWQKINSLYTAQGGENYITLGNFFYDSNTVLKTVYPAGYYGSGYIIDDVSVIPLDSIQLQADAGRDTTIVQGDSAFIGTLINGLDTVRWLQNGTTVIDSIRPGFWVHPKVNTCYVLTQTVNGFTSSDTVCVFVRGLPVLIKSYELRVISEENNFVRHTWQTANEVNVHHYEVEKSIDGKAFYSIGKVAANNQQQNRYSFNDENVVGGVSYYRVVGVDRDGKRTYSEVKSLVFSSKSLVAVFPNPCKDYIKVVGDDIQQITIKDVYGREVFKSPSFGEVGEAINVSTLANGTYLISIKTKANYVVQKFIKW